MKQRTEVSEPKVIKNNVVLVKLLVTGIYLLLALFLYRDVFANEVTPDDRRQLAKLLRVMSTLENIRSAIAYTGGGRIDLAKIDIGEAITALTASRTSLAGVAKLSQARNWLQRDTSKAIAWLNLAHGSIVK